MTEDLKKLFDNIEEFEKINPKPNLLYCHFGLKDKALNDRLFAIATNLPSGSGSLREIFENHKVILEIIKDKFGKDAVLELYVSNDDNASSIYTRSTLKDYLSSHQH